MANPLLHTLHHYAFGKKDRFLITSLGQMGTFWLAAQLNKHPHVFCTHAYDKPLWGAAGSPLTGDEGARQRHIIHHHFGKLRLKQFFREHAQATNKKFVGNAHAYNVDQVLAKMRDESYRHIKLVNLIRHPVTRIHSMVNCTTNEWFKQGYIDHLRDVPKRYLSHGRAIVQSLFPNQVAEFDDSLHRQFFVYAILHEQRSAGHVALAAQHDIPNMRYEDITTSRDHLKQLIQWVCQDDLPEIDTWLDQQVTYKKVNPHAAKSAADAQTLYATWEPWKKTLYDYMLQDDHFLAYSHGRHYDTLLP